MNQLPCPVFISSKLYHKKNEKKPGHYHACWCLGTRSCQVISMHDIDCKMSTLLMLTHWGRLTHICVSDLTIIASYNGLSPGRCQAIIWTNDGILLIGPLGTYLSIWNSNIFIKENIFECVVCEIASSLPQPQCVNLVVLMLQYSWRIVPIHDCCQGISRHCILNSLYKINRPLSPMMKDFNYLRHLSNDRKCKSMA